MAKSKKEHILCPDCKGTRKINAEECEFCQGTGIFSDCETQVKIPTKRGFYG